MKHLKTALVLALSLFGFTSAGAMDIRGTAGMGFEFGGDDLLKVTYTSGDTSSIAAGDGFYINGGVIFGLDAANTMDLSLTLGWKQTGVTATNGDATLSRFPIDAIFNYKNDKHHFGAGLTYHAAIDFSGSGVLSGVGTDMESNLGFLAQYDYSTSPNLAFGARFTSLSYELTEYDETADASSFGLYMAGRF